MKNAVLLTGELRTFEMTKYLHMNTIISKYDTDVFMGISYNEKLSTNTNTNEINNAIEFYKPIDTFILNDFDFLKERWTHILYRQYYVVKKTYELLKKHIDNNNTKYDLIIRLRFDQILYNNEVNILDQLLDGNSSILYNKKFIFEEIKTNTIYVFGIGSYYKDTFINDQFFYHNDSILDIMINFYDNISEIIDYCNKNNIGQKGCLIECVFYLYITKCNINIETTTIRGQTLRKTV